MNNLSDAILSIIANGEEQDVEFKSKAHAIGETICSFANTNDGTILVSVLDDGKIVGCPKKHEQVIANIAHTCKPSIYPLINSVEIGGKNVFVVKVRKSSQVHSFKNIAYLRVGTHDKPLSAEELIEFAREKKTFEFDSRICEGATLIEINDEKIRWFLQTAKIKRDYPIDEDTLIKGVLSHLNLLQNGKLTNAAILLFGRNPQRLYLQAEVKCMHFHGTEVEKPFETYHIYKSNVFDQVDNALGFVLDRLRRPVIPEAGKPTSKRPYEIPEFVIREAIVNAIAHRDYYSTAGVQVMVFTDRIEVWNPGELPPQLTLDSLRKPHPSIPRNPLVAESFYLTNYIEKAGSGTLEMIKQCRNAGLPEPNFEQKMGCFVTTVWRSILTNEYLKSLGLNERQKKSIKYIEKYGRITRAEYEKLNNVSERTANRELNNLINRKLIRREGKGPETHYVLARYGEIWRDMMIRLKGGKK